MYKILMRNGLDAVCGAKYKTRAGLTYHFTHAHKDPPAGGAGPGAAAAAVGAGAGPATGSDGDSRDSPHATPAGPSAQANPAQPATEYQDSYVTFLNNPVVGTGEFSLYFHKN